MLNTIDTPDQLVTDALAAATHINQRLPEASRQPEPLVERSIGQRSVLAVAQADTVSCWHNSRV